MLQVNENDEGVVFKVWVKPKSAKDEIRGLKDGALMVSVASPPIQGKANKACKALLAKVFGVGKSCVEIIGGTRSRTKIVRVVGIAPDKIRRIIDEKEKNGKKE